MHVDKIARLTWETARGTAFNLYHVDKIAKLTWETARGTAFNLQHGNVLFLGEIFRYTDIGCLAEVSRTINSGLNAGSGSCLLFT